ncbi:hypothetical protein CXG81DRAFT_23554 [Caulochytrium protostelioides]|uniref:Bud22 domain-containing protein n=1 Tax=Caulochytrium protostelioides TaxID=1555241 RepID=A0A4P9WZM5_9FUNG|nr:hypothetical protein CAUPRSCDRAFT_10320 [Caulochytrium protostelioides]RKP03863.1 hypothetical protein CXG81DRAFT_23554 [Caulochytrium protostelioides]|eukprot:RKP03863.1 hypothetical protein CXG81DRAFT_23554 [Caulochytrium protostelioides]
MPIRTNATSPGAPSQPSPRGKSRRTEPGCNAASHDATPAAPVTPIVTADTPVDSAADETLVTPTEDEDMSYLAAFQGAERPEGLASISDISDSEGESVDGDEWHQVKLLDSDDVDLAMSDLGSVDSDGPTPTATSEASAAADAVAASDNGYATPVEESSDNEEDVHADAPEASSAPDESVTGNEGVMTNAVTHESRTDTLPSDAETTPMTASTDTAAEPSATTTSPSSPRSMTATATPTTDATAAKADKAKRFTPIERILFAPLDPHINRHRPVLPLEDVLAKIPKKTHFWGVSGRRACRKAIENERGRLKKEIKLFQTKLDAAQRSPEGSVAEHADGAAADEGHGPPPPTAAVPDHVRAIWEKKHAKYVEDLALITSSGGDAGVPVLRIVYAAVARVLADYTRALQLPWHIPVGEALQAYADRLADACVKKQQEVPDMPVPSTLAPLVPSPDAPPTPFVFRPASLPPPTCPAQERLFSRLLQSKLMQSFAEEVAVSIRHLGTDAPSVAKQKKYTRPGAVTYFQGQTPFSEAVAPVEAKLVETKQAFVKKPPAAAQPTSEKSASETPAPGKPAGIPTSTSATLSAETASPAATTEKPAPSAPVTDASSSAAASTSSPAVPKVKRIYAPKAAFLFDEQQLNAWNPLLRDAAVMTAEKTLEKTEKVLHDVTEKRAKHEAKKEARKRAREAEAEAEAAAQPKKRSLLLNRRVDAKTLDSRFVSSLGSADGPGDLPQNRMGQRQRRALWERLYGKTANHVLSESATGSNVSPVGPRKADTADGAASSEYAADAPKAAAKAAPKAPAKAAQTPKTVPRTLAPLPSPDTPVETLTRKERRALARQQAEATGQPVSAVMVRKGPSSSGAPRAGASPGAAAASKTASAAKDTDMHGSWAAKRAEKVAIVPFAGKKITFE